MTRQTPQEILMEALVSALKLHNRASRVLTTRVAQISQLLRTPTLNESSRSKLTKELVDIVDVCAKAHRAAKHLLRTQTCSTDDPTASEMFKTLRT